MSLSVTQKGWFTVFMANVTVKANRIKVCCSHDMSPDLLILLQPNLVWWYVFTSLVERPQCCVQGQGHCEASKFQLFVRMISSEWLYLLYSNLASWCIIISQSVTRKDRFAVFKVPATVMAYVIKLWPIHCIFIECLFTIYFLYHWSRCDSHQGVLVYYH